MSGLHVQCICVLNTIDLYVSLRDTVCACDTVWVCVYCGECVCVCVYAATCVCAPSECVCKLRATLCSRARRTSGMILAAVWPCRPWEASNVQELLLQVSVQIELFVHSHSSAIVRMRSHSFKLQRD